jgi:hypothetical protein
MVSVKDFAHGLEGVKRKLFDVIEEASIAGKEHIEIILTKNSGSAERVEVCGVESCKLVYGRAPGSSNVETRGISIIADGIVRFYPDRKGRMTGYLLDTDKNRKWLASTMSTGTYKITDAQVEREIKSIAIDLNLGTSAPVISEHNRAILKNAGTEQAMTMLSMAEELQRLRDLVDKYKAGSDVDSDATTKPLAGKRLNRKVEGVGDVNTGVGN